MSCTLGKYTNYEVAQVIKDGDRTVVKLAHPPVECPDGVLNNSHTQVLEDSAVSVPTLSFSTRLNAPVVLMPHHTSDQTTRVDPLDVPKDHGIGFFGVCGWILLVVLVALAFRWLAKKMREAPAEGQGPAIMAARRTLIYDSDAHGTTRSSPTTTVVNNNGGGGHGFVEGLIVGNMLHPQSGSSRPWFKESEPTTTSYTYTSPPETSSSSYSSDSGSSYSSDSSSSYSSDSSSSFGSD